jgi:predicted RNA polymerase sigma factor
MQGETAVVERVFREEYGRLIASLVRRFGDIDIAEEAASEALVIALEKWRLAHHHRGQPRDRPDPPREAARREAPGGLDEL